MVDESLAQQMRTKEADLVEVELTKWRNGSIELKGGHGHRRCRGPGTITETRRRRKINLKGLIRKAQEAGETVSSVSKSEFGGTGCGMAFVCHLVCYLC